MLRPIKHILYFKVAGYFRFFARVRLKRWAPRVVVITGSNGKTTALNLVEAQLGDVARYSHGANSSFGIPFDILGLKRSAYALWEWPIFAILAPFCVLKAPYRQKIYVVEADCDRPYEGQFLSELLKPEVVVWLSSARTHSMNFEKSVRAGTFADVDKAIAHEFGYFIEVASKLVVVNADEPKILDQFSRTHAEVFRISRTALEHYAVGIGGTEFVIHGATYRVPLLLPQEVMYAVIASTKVAEYFGVPPSGEWQVSVPPGRSSVFRGIKNTVILDSTYNANASSVGAILEMAKQFPSRETWVVLGDLVEQGAEEKEEHEKVARMLTVSEGFKKIIFVGPRMEKYALPLVPGAIAFEKPREALEYLRRELRGGETLVFKGARFLEGVVEHLLADKADAEKLCRREEVWRRRRKAWGL